MRDLKHALWTVGWLISGPILFIGWVPWWIAHRPLSDLLWQGKPWQWLGAWLCVNGIGLVAWCAWLFFQDGQGSPLPFHPPERFVVRGPYRLVRNPMVIGLLMILAGETLVYGSVWVTVYSAVIATLAVLFILLVEEPDLQRRFGPLYLSYRRQVPRWFPRIPGKSSRLDL